MLLVHPSCTQYFLGHVRMILKPNPAFVSDVCSCSPIDLAAFAASLEEQWSQALVRLRGNGKDRGLQQGQPAVCLLGQSSQG